MHYTSLHTRLNPTGNMGKFSNWYPLREKIKQANSKRQMWSIKYNL